MDNVEFTVGRLAPGTKVRGAQEDYEIEKYLGLGLTSLVYRARHQASGRLVALKVLRDDAGQVSTDHFWHEPQVLSELRDAGVTAVPQVFELQRTGPVRFLAIEFLDRAIYQPLDELDGPLQEPEAVEISRQALQVLQRLHEQVGRTYTDMQLKDFWWANATQTLKILDWNHVSTQREHIQPSELHSFGVTSFEALARRDLARWGAYFFRLLTGQGALEQGETVAALARRAGEQWTRISVAARQIITRALHPNPALRYQSAADFLQAVLDLQNRWQGKVDIEAEKQRLDDLLEGAKNAQAPQAETRLCLDEVDARLDLLERLGEDIPGYRKRLERLTMGISGIWSSGLLYYQAQQYAEAARIWEEEATAQGRIDLWRWVFLAQSGAQNPAGLEPVRDRLETLVKDLKDDASVIQAQRWDAVCRAQPWIEESPARFLGMEITAAQQIREARSAADVGDKTGNVEQWDAAATYFDQAARTLAPHPHAALLRQVNGWDALEDHAESQRRKGAAYRDASKQITALQEKLRADFPAGVAYLRSLILMSPGAQDVLAYCESYAREVLNANPEQALEVLDVLRLYGHVSGITWEDLRSKARRRLVTMQALAAQAQAIEEAAERDRWDVLQRAAAALLPGSRDEPRYVEMVKRLEEAYRARVEGDQLEAARRLDEVLTTLGDVSQERAAELAEKESAVLQTITAQIEAAEAGAWRQVHGLVSELPPATRAIPGYAELVAHVGAQYKVRLQAQSLLAAQQLHEALTALGEVAKSRERELYDLEDRLHTHRQRLQTEVEDLQNEESTCHQAAIEEEKRQAADEARSRRIQQFADWAATTHRKWEGFGKVQSYADCVKRAQEMDDDLKSLKASFGDLVQENECLEVVIHLTWSEDWIDEQLKSLQDNQKHLDTAEQALAAATSEAGRLTDPSLEAARKACEGVKRDLSYAVPDQDRTRHDLLLARTQALEDLLNHIRDSQVIAAVRKAQQLDAQLRTQVQNKPSGKAWAETFETIEAFEEARRAIQEKLSESDWRERFPGTGPIFPPLTALEQQHSTWEPLRFFLSSGQGAGDSGDSSVADLLDKALTTAKAGVAARLDEMFGALENFYARVSRAGRIGRWQLFSSVMLGLALLASFLAQMGRLGSIDTRLVTAPAATVITVTPKPSVETPLPTTEEASVETATPIPPTNTPMPTSTSTPTATPEPTPRPPFAGVTLDWPRGETLYDAPPFTLTAAAGWTLKTTTTIADGEVLTSYVATDSQQELTVTVIISDVTGQTVQTGTWAIRGTAVVWLPALEGPALPAGMHTVAVKAENVDQAPQFSTMQTLTVTAPLTLTASSGRVEEEPSNHAPDIEGVVGKGDLLFAVGWTLDGGQTHARVRTAQSRKTYWVNVSTGGYVEDEGQDLVHRVRDTLPEMRP